MLRAFFSIAAKLRAMMPWIKERAVAKPLRQLLNPDLPWALPLLLS